MLAMDLPTLYTIKKAFYYNFFPTKTEEDSMKSRKAPDGSTVNVGRQLIEIRDVYPPPAVNPGDPWVIKKTLNQYEAAFGKLVLSVDDTFEHVIRYWTLDMANYLPLGHRVGVQLWDVTEDTNPRKYQSNEVYFQMMANDDCVLSCLELFKCRNLKLDDDILMYWDSRESCFKFKLVL